GVRKGEFLDGAVGPAASFLIPISGSLHGRAPFVGARFRRDTKKAGTVAVQIDLAPLRITSGCPTTGCDETAVLFAPAYEASVRPAWGRVYGEAGFLLAGVYSQGPDRGRVRVDRVAAPRQACGAGAGCGARARRTRAVAPRLRRADSPPLAAWWTGGIGPRRQGGLSPRPRASGDQRQGRDRGLRARHLRSELRSPSRRSPAM